MPRLQDTFPISVKKFYTDVDGLIIDKSILPVNLQVELPFYLFGKMDSDGAYKIGNESNPPPLNTWILFKIQTYSTFDFLLFTGLNNFQGQLSVGDLVFIYSDSLVNPTYYAYVVITSNQRSYSSILQSLDKWGPNIDTIVYESQNVNQYEQVFDYVVLNRTGLYKTNQFSPIDFRDPYVQQGDIIRMAFNQFGFDMNLNRFIGLYSYILFASDRINFNVVYKLGE